MKIDRTSGKSTFKTIETQSLKVGAQNEDLLATINGTTLKESCVSFIFFFVLAQKTEISSFKQQVTMLTTKINALQTQVNVIFF